MSSIFDVLDEEYEENIFDESEEETLDDAINFLESEEEVDEACSTKKEACGSKKEGCKSEMSDEEMEEEAAHYLEAADNLEKIVVEDPYSGEF